MTDLKDPNRPEFGKKLEQLAEESGKLLLCTDFDGTLVRFTEVPTDTQLPKGTEELLRRLAGLKSLHLAVVSGRGFRELTRLVPIEEATLAGNHGLKIRFEDGEVREPEVGRKAKSAVEDLKEEVHEEFGDRDGLIIEDKSFGLALHYRKYEGNEEEVKEKFYRIWDRHEIPLLEVLQGAKLLEVRPAGWNKGDAVKLLRERWENPPTVYIGDDTTDEDAFGVLAGEEEGFPILVGEEERETAARYRLEDPDKVGEFLESIYGQFATGDPA